MALHPTLQADMKRKRRTEPQKLAMVNAAEKGAAARIKPSVVTPNGSEGIGGKR